MAKEIISCDSAGSGERSKYLDFPAMAGVASPIADKLDHGMNHKRHMLACHRGRDLPLNSGRHGREGIVWYNRVLRGEN